MSPLYHWVFIHFPESLLWPLRFGQNDNVAVPMTPFSFFPYSLFELFLKLNDLMRRFPVFIGLIVFLFFNWMSHPLSMQFMQCSAISNGNLVGFTRVLT